jgi:hypothetical protein
LEFAPLSESPIVRHYARLLADSGDPLLWTNTIINKMSELSALRSHFAQAHTQSHDESLRLSLANVCRTIDFAVSLLAGAVTASIYENDSRNGYDVGWYASKILSCELPDARFDKAVTAVRATVPTLLSILLAAADVDYHASNRRNLTARLCVWPARRTLKRTA